MKAFLYLSVSALALIMVACGDTGNQEKRDENPQVQTVENKASNVVEKVLFDVYDDVDWDRPLYTLGDNGDTIEMWTYNQQGLLVQYSYKEDEYNYSENSYRYDAEGRLIGESGSSFTGNVREYYEDYTYSGKVRTAMGKHFTEGYPSYFKTKEVCYYMDADFKFDTLCQEYELEVSWDDYSENEGDIDEASLHLVRYFTKKYTQINGETKVAEECFYCEDYDHPGTYHFGHKFINTYNSQGLLFSSVYCSADGTESKTEYTYSGNVKDGTTYYAKKSQFKD